MDALNKEFKLGDLVILNKTAPYDIEYLYGVMQYYGYARNPLSNWFWTGGMVGLVIGIEHYDLVKVWYPKINQKYDIPSAVLDHVK